MLKGQWSTGLGPGPRPMGWAGQAFPSGPAHGPMGLRYKPMWLASRPNIVYIEPY